MKNKTKEEKKKSGKRVSDNVHTEARTQRKENEATGLKKKIEVTEIRTHAQSINNHSGLPFKRLHHDE